MSSKDLMEVLHFACTLSFWRMTFLWTYSLIISYIRLLTRSMTHKSVYHHCAVSPLPPITSSAPGKTSGRRLPICIITGRLWLFQGKASVWFLLEDPLISYQRSIACQRLLMYHLPQTCPSSTSFLTVWQVMSNIRRQSEEAHFKGFQVDLSSFSSIMRFKESLDQWLLDSDMHPSIQLLINNAGILATTSRLTTEGHDLMMGTNYIGAFSVTEILLPLLKNSPVPSRIVNLTSFTHRNVSGFRAEKETVSGKHFSKFKHYPCAEIYEFSKLCMLLFSYELHRQLHLTEGSQSISVIAVDPGAVKTNIMREVPWCISQVAFVVLGILGLLQSPEVGVSSILDAALAPPETSGLYFFGGKGRTVDSSALSYDLKLSRELWATSCHIFQDSLSAQS